MVTDSDGVVYEAAMLQNGNVGFGVRQKDDYWLASVLDREQVVHPDDVKLHNQEAAAGEGGRTVLGAIGGMVCTGLGRTREMTMNLTEGGVTGVFLRSSMR